ncbi:hypothetical protein EU527_14210 [Candidatus Thorarchaeota archaeon]|nr:MAG: hypothetical protein EU527_14210 [Candidatus Thorarchaeota archaeon]
MQQTIQGTIVSRQLGTFGKDEIVYGYIGIKTSSGEQIAIKVDSYTWYETLELGSDVLIEAVNLGSTDIVVARKISISPNLIGQSDQSAVATT